MSTPQRKLKQKPRELTETEAAQKRHAAWETVRPAKRLTPGNVVRDVYDAKRDIETNPRRFPERLRGRLEQYVPKGPDIHKPAFTYPYGRSDTTPHRARRDLQRAQEAVEGWIGKSEESKTEKPRRHRVKYPSAAKPKG